MNMPKPISDCGWRLLVAAGALILLNVRLNAQEPTRTQLFDAAERFCRAIGWSFDRAHAVVERPEAIDGRRRHVSTKDLILTVSADTLMVERAANLGYSQRRRTPRGAASPFRKTQAEWFAHGQALVRLVRPSITLKPRRFESFLENDPEMRGSNSRTVRMNFSVEVPSAQVGDEVTLILDRDEGKVLNFAYWRARRR